MSILENLKNWAKAAVEILKPAKAVPISTEQEVFNQKGDSNAIFQLDGCFYETLETSNKSDKYLVPMGYRQADNETYYIHDSSENFVKFVSNVCEASKIFYGGFYSSVYQDAYNALTGDNIPVWEKE